MATLHVRGVPDDLYRDIGARAEENGTSITAETIRLLRRAMELERPGRAALVDAIRAARVVRSTDSPSAVELIREDRGR